MREKKHYNVGDTVRVCTEGYGGITFQSGVVKQIEERDISYHGSAEIVYDYHVLTESGMVVCNYMHDQINRYCSKKTYISPVPTKKEVEEKIRRENEELREKIRKMEKEIQKKKDFLSDVYSGKISLDTIKLY